MKTVIIKYNAGNVTSVALALERIGVSAIVTDVVEEIRSADRIIFPGVGEASSAMEYLRKQKLDELIVSLEQPVLGICLGMQLMCTYSEEGDTKCLGLFDTDVKLFRSGGSIEEKIKVPQIGWNTINGFESKLFTGLKENEHMYFVHGYYVEEGKWTVAKTNYGLNYSSALQKNNFYGVQFHPEKSGDAGQKILENFIGL